MSSRYISTLPVVHSYITFPLPPNFPSFSIFRLSLLTKNDRFTPNGHYFLPLGLFNDTCSQQGHSMSCMTTLFLNLQITSSDVRPHIKWVVGLVITYGCFNVPQVSVWVCMGLHTHFITPEGLFDVQNSCDLSFLTFSTFAHTASPQSLSQFSHFYLPLRRFF